MIVCSNTTPFIALASARLIDERLGRNMAEYQGLNVMGTLGVLVKAKREGLIPGFRVAAETMCQQGIRYSQELINRISRHMGE